MTAQTVKNAGHPLSARRERLHDLMIVSSFGLWAVLLGLVPPVAYRLLTGS